MGTEWIWVIVVVVILFGASRLPSMGRNVGLGIKEFKKGINEASRDDDGDKRPEAKPSGDDPNPRA